ncbi:group 1 glycosyl transferase [Sphaerotilus natans subsp. natans DSM 6575]|uniref:Group 1 glycosyl transferase n=1 Tax=Sphaerotilus natans subsp. natans DSM 6575 TaxID=1286631 RepID=A0A059KIE7_9BURK|nr:glycosyltransferase [Sphaerotilus natans]KDB51135.1 group 1 glycosyl transferase [Sphaerotilus natans subsp. natans DSM 6575]SIR55307.1 Glycosyltransferase involved in cell wall bisynthesis [Sphaerotilus natans]
MRLLHIISSVDPRGGGPIEGIKQRGIFLQNQGHTVEVLSLDNPDISYVSEFPLQVHAVGPGWSSYGYCKATQPWLEQHARDYDHIIIHGLWQHHGHAASRALHRMQVPYHVFTHGMLDPWFKHTYPLKHIKKSVYWLLSEYWVLKHAKTVLFTSEEERLRARESFWMYSANEVVVPYGTAPPPAEAEPYRTKFFLAHPELVGKHILLYLSRIHPKKGCDLLIEAFARVAQKYDSVHLLMAGTGDPAMIDSLKDLAEKLKVSDRITWLGMVENDAKWEALTSANAFILPSHQENFGIAVAEALGCGLPVLISDKINIWREIQADSAGYVAPDTLEGTHFNLSRWLAMDPKAQEKMSLVAKETFIARYSISSMAHGLLSALQQA